MSGERSMEVKRDTEQSEHDKIGTDIVRINGHIRKLINDITVFADYMYGEPDLSVSSEQECPASVLGIMGQLNSDLEVTLTLLNEATVAFERLRR